jgi:prophage tail gpP-like protein
MKLEVNGVQYDNFISAECETRLDALANFFSFTAINPNGVVFPFKGGESCKVIVDGEVVLTGEIEVVEVSYDGGDHEVTVQGRSTAAKLLDSTIGLLGDIVGEGLTLRALIEAVIAHLGLDIKVRDDVRPRPFSIAEELAAPEPGDNAFRFIEKFTKKRQVMLHPSPDGGIVIAANSGIQAAGRVQHILNAFDNNVISSNFRYDTTGRFNAYFMASQLNPVVLNVTGGSDLATLVNQGGGVSDPGINKGKQMVIVTDAPFSDAECESRARWEADVRKARGLVYSAVVNKYREAGDTGKLWGVNKLYQINDDFIGKNEPMLCNSVKYSLNNDDGRVTGLGFVGPNSYTLSLQDFAGGSVSTNFLSPIGPSAKSKPIISLASLLENLGGV